MTNRPSIRGRPRRRVRFGQPPRVLEWLCLGVLALLGYAILYPVISPVCERAPQSSCLSNQKQLALATLQYAQDWDDTYPAAWRGTAPRGEHAYTWRLMLLPYVKSTRLFQCPSLPKPGRRHLVEWDGAAGASTAAEWDGWSGYAANDVHSQPGHPTELFSGDVRVDQVLKPAGTVMLTDGPGPVPWLWYCHNRHGFVHAADLGGTRHNEGANYAFADGHVKWYRPEDVPCQDWLRKPECWWSIE